MGNVGNVDRAQSAMGWRDQILSFAEALGRDKYEDRLGVGVDFEDGCDAFWVLPGEITSTIPVPADGPVPVKELIAAYERISSLRRRTLHVVRHYLASRNIQADRCRGGEWGLVLDGGASTSMSVGAHLTAVARDTDDVYEVVKAAIEPTWLRKVPSRKRIDRYLNTQGPPPGERAIGAGPEPEPPATQTIQVALRWMGLCNALKDIDENSTAESIAMAAQPRGRIGQTMMRLAERLPNVEAHIELMKPGTLSIAFDDGYSGSFDIDTKSRELAKLIAEEGPTVAGDQLADEYRRLNSERSAVLSAIGEAALDRGWHKEEIGLALFGIDNVVYLGETSREVSFKPESVNDLLQTGTPAAALRALLSSDPGFADACIAALKDPRPEAAQITLPTGPLAPRDIPAAQPLRTLDAAVVAELDDSARKTLTRFLRGDERALREYQNRDLYDPEVDTWASMQDWVGVAERHVGGEWPDPTAILILLDAGDPRGDAAARKYLTVAEPNHEVSDAEVTIVWRYRHSHPEKAREWFGPQPFEDVPFLQQRAKLGDPVARRSVMLESAEAFNAEGDSSPVAVKTLPPGRQEQVHRELLIWARTDHHWSGPDAGKLRVALAMGWRDVADALQENPYAVPGLLTIDRRSDQFDEPGMLLAEEFLLVWSRLSPSRFLAQVIATAHSTDLVALAEEAARRSVMGKPDSAAHLGMSSQAYRNWLKEAQVAMAIAWTRCRRHLG